MTARGVLRWGAVSLTAGVLGASQSGCELIAGTVDRTLDASGDGGSGSSSSRSSVGASGAGGASAGATGGGGGNGGPPHPWPDSATTFCSIPDVAVLSCAETSGTNFYRQDGDFVIHHPAYASSGNGTDTTITDSVTGLIWQGDFSSVIGKNHTWSGAKSVCENRDAVGATDWRLPTRRELASLLDTGHSKVQSGLASIFPSVFDELILDAQLSSAFYWVDTEAQGDTNNAWAFRLLPYNFTVARVDKTSQFGGRALCVRGPDVYPKPQLVIEAEVVRDANTGLVWQRDQSMSQETWAEALQYCNDLSQGGIDDFRLPTLKELLYLVDDTQLNPAIDQEAFPMTQPETFWTSTPYAGEPTQIFIVSFNSGAADVGDYQGSRYIRCVH